MVRLPYILRQALIDARSSEDVPGIFATLSIVLPTNHSGGEITVIHAGEKRVFDPSPYSNTEASWTGW